MTGLATETIGHGPDVVLVHGWGLHGGLWAPAVERLRGRFRCHVVDLPGHGHSHDTTLPAPDIESWARSLLACLPAPAAWVGWSLGGMLALAVARVAPAAVTRLALIGTTPKFVTGDDWPHGLTKDTFGQFAAGLETDYRATLLRFLSLQAGRGGEGRALLRILRACLGDRHEPTPAALRAGLKLLQESDLRQDLGRIATAALVVHGDCDRLVPAAAAGQLAAQLPAGEMCRIADAGHAPMWSHPDRLCERLTAFLERPGP